MAIKCYKPIVARYSEREARKLAKDLRKSQKLSFDNKKPSYKVSREKVKGKSTDRWLVEQDCGSLNKRRARNL